MHSKYFFKNADSYIQAMDIEDKRHYKRYRINAECDIEYNDQTYKGRVFDYSDGAGIVMDQSSQFSTGMQANIKIPDMGVEFRGEVAWTRQAGGYLRVGFTRVGHFRKSLMNYKLPDVLIGIQRSSKTGHLEIKSGSIVKIIYFKNGDMIYASSNIESDRLGDLLLKEGNITLNEFNQASEILLKTGKKLGKILVEMGLLSPNELFKALCHQIEEISLSLFELEEGLFEFREEPLQEEELITLQISTANIIYRGMKRVHDAAYIKDMCPPENAVLTLSQNPMNIFQSLSLEPADKDILYSVSKKISLKAAVNKRHCHPAMAMAPALDCWLSTPQAALLDAVGPSAARPPQAPDLAQSLPVRWAAGSYLPRNTKSRRQHRRPAAGELTNAY